MKILLLPVAGQSARYPGMRPKWLLTMPNGKLMKGAKHPTKKKTKKRAY